MYKSNILFLFLLFAVGLPSSSQNNIRAELDVDFSSPNKAEEEFTVFPLKTMVKETLFFENYHNDSIKLNIENMSMPVLSFFYPSVRLSASWENGEIADLSYTFAGQSLRFVIPDSFCKVVLTYEFQSDYFFRGGYQNIEYLVPYIYDWTSWYFTCEGLKVDKVKFNVPDSQYLFANLPMVKENSAVVLNAGKLKGNNISFYLLAKQYYDYSECKSGNVDIAVYQLKGSIPRNDLKRYVPGTNSHSYLTTHLKLAKDAVKPVKEFLGIDAPMKVSIADKRLSDQEKVVWGNTTIISDREAFVLIDSTMWDDNSLHHELFHFFDQNVLGNIARSDSARFFFTESLVEYLSVYLRYKDKKVREEVFTQKILTYSKSKELNSSVFGLESNSLNGSGEYGGSYVIRQAKATKRVSLNDFEWAAKLNGVTDEEWKWFMKYL